MTHQKYAMSFTAGTLLYHESVKLAELYRDLKDWRAVKNNALDDNLLQARTQSAAKRICRETISRLKLLTDAERDLLLNGTRQEQNHLLWLAICKRYRFIRDFAVEVLREKYLRLDLMLTNDDYEIFFNNKAEWHDELESLAESTREKLRQVVMKMLREADLLTGHNTINPAMLSPDFIKTVYQDSKEYLAVFPVSEADIREWIT